MSELFAAKAAMQDGRVKIWETHPAHVSPANPTGEIFISGDGRPVTVAPTPRVQRLLADGVLVKVEQPAVDAGEDLPVGDGDDLPDATVTVGGEDIPGTVEETVTAPDATETPGSEHERVTGVPLWGGEYDDLTAAEIIAIMGTLTDVDKAAVKTYEAAHKNRKTIMEA